MKTNVLVIFLTFVLITSCAQKKSLSPYLGQWVVIKCISADYNDTSITYEERTRELGGALQINDDLVILNLTKFNDTCLSPHIKIDTVVSKNYFENDRKLLKWLNVRSTNTILIKSSCNSVFLKELFIINDEELVLNIDGFLMFFKKQPTTP